MNVIRAAHYGETVAALMADPIIIDMAAGLAAVPMDKIVHPAGGARHEFMMAALDEYHTRGGKIGTHIGGPAEALLNLLGAEAL
jgi:hypothetical protein